MYVRIAVNVDRWLLTYTSDSVNTGILALEVSVNIDRTPFSNVCVWPRTRHFDNVQFRHFSSFTGRAQKCSLFASKYWTKYNINTTATTVARFKGASNYFFFSNRDGRSTRMKKKKTIISDQKSRHRHRRRIAQPTRFPVTWIFPFDSFFRHGPLTTRPPQCYYYNSLIIIT